MSARWIRVVRRQVSDATGPREYPGAVPLPFGHTARRAVSKTSFARSRAWTIQLRIAARRLRPYARRLPRGRKPTSPGEIVQRDTPAVSPHPGRHAIKQFTAHDPVAKWTRAQAWRRATAHNARRFLDKLQADMPFPIQAIQVDGGCGFKADFETECQRRGIDLFERPPRSPKLNGHVERNNGAGDTSSTPHGTCPTTTSTTSTDGSTPSPTSSTPSDRTRPLADTPLPSTFTHRQPKRTPCLICPEPGHGIDSAFGRVINSGLFTGPLHGASSRGLFTGPLHGASSRGLFTGPLHG